jgi:hypothetical protein
MASQLSYAPLLSYCNMFSIYYLEIISSTKLVSQKLMADKSMGRRVNFAVTCFYIVLFIMMFFMQWGRDFKNKDNPQTAVEVIFLKAWFYKMKPFDA